MGLIPARAGSKGIANKNKKYLGGRPLVAHTIIAAQQAANLDRLWVSTDDPEIAAIAQDYGVSVPWLRPNELAQDGSLLSDALVHLLGRLRAEENYHPDAVLVLQPTSPFRRPETINKAIALFGQYGEESVISVTAARQHPFWCYRIRGESGILEPFVANLETPPPRQKWPDAYVLDGSIYLISTENFLKTRSFFSPNDHALIVPTEEALDLDTPLDWQIAECLWRKRKESVGIS